MEELLSPEDVERLASERGLSIKELCAKAEVAHTTFYRWRARTTKPSIEVYRRLCGALREPA